MQSSCNLVLPDLRANLTNSSCSLLSSSRMSWQDSNSRKHLELFSNWTLVSSSRSLNTFIWMFRLLASSRRSSPLTSPIFLHSSTKSWAFSTWCWKIVIGNISNNLEIKMGERRYNMRINSDLIEALRCKSYRANFEFQFFWVWKILQMISIICIKF